MMGGSIGHPLIGSNAEPKRPTQPDPRTKCKDFFLPGLRKLMYFVAVLELVILCLEGVGAVLVLFGLNQRTP